MIPRLKLSRMSFYQTLFMMPASLWYQTKDIKKTTSNFKEYRCKNFQQYTSKPNAIVHYKDHISLPGRIYPRGATVFQHLQINNKCLKLSQQNEDQNHMIIFLVVLKTFDKIQQCFTIKPPQIYKGIEGHILGI